MKATALLRAFRALQARARFPCAPEHGKLLPMFSCLRFAGTNRSCKAGCIVTLLINYHRVRKTRSASCGLASTGQALACMERLRQIGSAGTKAMAASDLQIGTPSCLEAAQDRARRQRRRPRPTGDAGCRLQNNYEHE